MSEIPIFDVFQKGLIRGSERLPHDPVKLYAYVEHPIEGWRVYLRSCVFLHPTGVLGRQNTFHPAHFLVVKRRGARWTTATWEPPKGQMEGKDMKQGNKSVMELLKENVQRETEEESHITEINRLKHTGLVFQSQESTYPNNTFFQYHIFQGFVTGKQIQQSFDTFKWIKEHPEAFKRWRRDRREKDAVSWFDPNKTKLNPRWCPDIVALYLQHVHGPI
jgi:ADP-ribose pyrophosphatase YjhB (NUDIX family)